MPAATTLAVNLYASEPSMTAVASRLPIYRETVLPEVLWPLGMESTRRQTPERTPTDVTDDGFAEAPKTRADITIAQLLQFERLENDWDGNSAAKPLTESLSDAREFIRSLAPESTIPGATLHADGHAVLLLQGADIYAEIEFLGNKKIGFYAQQGGRVWGDEIFFDRGTLPEGLSEIGFVIEE